MGKYITLAKLANGKEAIIKSLNNGIGMENKLNAINIRKGKKIKKIISQPLHGPSILSIDNHQCAIGYNMAKKIMVEEI